MIVAVIAGMLILAYIYTPRLIWDEDLVEEFKEGREEKDNKGKGKVCSGRRQRDAGVHEFHKNQTRYE